MDKQTRFARISKKAFREIAVRLEHDEEATQLTINETVIGYQTEEGAFIEAEAYKQIVVA